MSVINKMLRDLDARRAEGALPDLPREELRSAAMQGTMSVAGRTSALPSRRLGVLLALLLLALMACAAWYWQEMDAAQAPAPQGAPPALVAVSPPVVLPEAEAPASVASAPASSPTSTPVLTKPPTAPTPPSVVSTNMSLQGAAAPAARPATVAPRAVAPVPPPTVAQKAPAAAVPAPGADLASQRRVSALQETMAQAQSLWVAGSRDAAVELMREAVAVAERVPTAESELPVLVRELARMELALGRSAAVLDLLVRLEPRLSTQADLWAVRGNAAQRLGRHPEAVQAYLAALRLRPDESRWMLGAAVSLAALGQLEAAALQAEQARALGPVSPEVLTYLRQAGVPLR